MCFLLINFLLITKWNVLYILYKAIKLLISVKVKIAIISNNEMVNFLIVSFHYQSFTWTRNISTYDIQNYCVNKL